MQLFRTFSISAALTTIAMAQDCLTLTNGDVVSGAIRTMADGKVTIVSPVLGEIIVGLTEITNLVTADQVELQTVTGESLRRRITGIEDASLCVFGGGAAIPLDSVDMINPPPAEEPKWTGSVAFNGMWVDGNTRRRTVGATGEAVRKTDADRITVDAHWDYAEDKPVGADWNLTQRRAGAGAKYDYFIDERWYALLTTRVLGDTFADLDLRLTAGAGVGYTLIDDDTTQLTAEAGLSYFDETYRSNTPSKDYVAARVAYKLAHQMTKDTKLNHSVEAYPSLEDSNDVYLQMKTELITNLSGSMIASLAHVMDYDNTPSPGLKRTDHRVLLSIGWSF
ncbi:MAG: DUF481 domain-containing protein [Planctomycetes bacterium]|nr:DUF481 domain-containing protein [Planctomycetota bacterium]